MIKINSKGGETTLVFDLTNDEDIAAVFVNVFTISVTRDNEVILAMCMGLFTSSIVEDVNSKKAKDILSGVKNTLVKSDISCKTMDVLKTLELKIKEAKAVGKKIGEITIMNNDNIKLAFE